MPVHVSERAILHLPLADEIPAYVFGDLIHAIDQSYSALVWLAGRAAGQDLPELARFQPHPGDQLMLERVDIGTPNFADLAGLTDILMPLVGMLGGALGLVKVVVTTKLGLAEAEKVRAETAKSQAETEQTQAETHKLQLEIAKLELLDTRGQNAYEAKRISRTELHQIEETARMFASVCEELLPRFAREPSLVLTQVESPPDGRAASDYDGQYMDKDTRPTAAEQGRARSITDEIFVGGEQIYVREPAPDRRRQ